MRNGHSLCYHKQERETHSSHITLKTDTVEPRFNESLCNEALGIMNVFFAPTIIHGSGGKYPPLSPALR